MNYVELQDDIPTAGIDVTRRGEEGKGGGGGEGSPGPSERAQGLGFRV